MQLKPQSFDDKLGYVMQMIVVSLSVAKHAILQEQVSA